MAALVSFNNIDFFFKGREFRRQRVFIFHFLKKRSSQLKASLPQPLDNISASQTLLLHPSPQFLQVIWGGREWTWSSGSVWPTGRQKRRAKILCYPRELSRPEIIRAIATQVSRIHSHCQWEADLPSHLLSDRLGWGGCNPYFNDTGLFVVNLGLEPEEVT